MKKNRSFDPVNFPSFADWVIQNPERILRNKRILEINVQDFQGIQRQLINIDHTIFYEDLETGLRDLAKKLSFDENEFWERFTRTRIHSQFRTVESRLNPENLLDIKTKRVIDLLLDKSFDFFSYFKPPNVENKFTNNSFTDTQVS